MSPRTVLVVVVILAIVGAALAVPLFLRSQGELVAASVPAGSQPFSFTPPLHIDPAHNASEPSIKVDAQGRIFAGGPIGIIGGFQGYLWRSVDNGTNWQFIHDVADKRVGPGLGGGDTDIAITPGGRIYYADLWLGDLSVTRSDDGGLTWTQGSPVASNIPSTDRQWLGVYGENVVYLAYNQIPYGPMVSKSLDGGITWVSRPALPPTQTLNIWSIGNMVVNPRDGSLYLAFTGCTQTVDCWAGGETTGVEVWVTRSFDGGQSFSPVMVHRGNMSAHLFTSMAMDTAGNLYVVWSETQDGRDKIWLATSTDQGAHWSAAKRVGFGIGQAVFPWVVAGSPGRVGVAFYGTTSTANPETSDPSLVWYPYYAQSLNALNATTDWNYGPATSVPNHIGQICMGGITCSSGGDRTLGDFFQLALMPDGATVIIYNDNHDTCALGKCSADAYVTFIRQVGGDKLYG